MSGIDICADLKFYFTIINHIASIKLSEHFEKFQFNFLSNLTLCFFFLTQFILVFVVLPILMT